MSKYRALIRPLSVLVLALAATHAYTHAHAQAHPQARAQTAPAHPHPASPPFLMVMDFNQDVRNRLGGYYNKFESAPSSALTWLSPDVVRGQAGRSLRVTSHRGDAGFCGVWVHLFDFKAHDPQYLDARPYKYLSFWVKGAHGGEDFLIKLADRKYIEQEDSLPLGHVGQFLPGGVTTDWQEVLVPLTANRRVNLQQLGGVTLEFTNPGDQVIYIDDISFKADPATPTPATQAGDVPPPAREPLPRAMWIWHVDPLLESEQARQDLFTFCDAERINQVWVQLPYTFHPTIDLTKPLQGGDAPDDVVCVIADPDKVRLFLRQAHARGLKVHVLEGYPEFAQRQYHRFPIAIVRAVIRFNQAGEPDERYDGIHLDNEPYLLVGWHDPERRQQILTEFLELNEILQQIVDAESDMEYGIDIPFWWNQPDPATGQSLGEVDYHGVCKSATYHLIDMLDNVGIMNYRDTADGADGMIIYGGHVLQYADSAGGAKVYIGVETFAYDPTEVWMVAGLPHLTFNAILGEPSGGLTMLSRTNGFKVKTFTDDQNVHVGLELPPHLDAEGLDRLNMTMLAIAKRFGAPIVGEFAANAQHAATHALKALNADPEWLDPARKDIVDPDSGAVHPGMIATRIMLPKITFGDNTYDEFQLQTQTAEDFFRRYNSYAGLAIHYYATYRRMVERHHAQPATTDAPATH